MQNMLVPLRDQQILEAIRGVFADHSYSAKAVETF